MDFENVGSCTRESEGTSRATFKPAKTVRVRVDAGVATKRQRIQPSRYFRWKYRMEWVIAMGLAVPALPIIGVLYCLVRLTSRGPGFYAQERMGLNGKRFLLLKLRSMRIDAESGTGPVWAQKNDHRVTGIGRFLRFSHLDEFPQLFNVIRGDMTLVGPRPERPFFVEQLEQKFPRYTQRLLVRPGITGMAQIYLPPDENDESVRKKLSFDLEYIRTATFGLDARIWICTALRLLGLRHGIGPRLAGLDRLVDRYRDRIRAERAEATPLHVQLRRKAKKKKRQFVMAISPLSDSSLELFLEPEEPVEASRPAVNRPR
jgi:lipopolysaccharide/colanic/teichoic acid biosynthesis glycosyltransferase